MTKLSREFRNKKQVKKLYTRKVHAFFQMDSCSTFLLKKGDGFLIGHNLDEFTVSPTPGAIVINKRNEKKVGVTYSQIQSSVENLASNIKWTSKYGSTTFNVEGKAFIDGGLNEKGLYIQEMTLVGGQMPGEGSGDLPCLHMGMWMQYVLDNFTSVQEVIDCLSSVTMDGHSWHFFVCDARGARAAIDFAEGTPVIHKDDKMPYSLMTNYFYAEEVENLHHYQGFGGQKLIDLTDMGGRGVEKDTRFVHASHLMENPPATIDIDYAFKILFAMDRSSISTYGGGRHWSYVIDTNENKVYVETRTAKQRKSININAFDYSDGQPAQLLDLHFEGVGDVTRDFKSFTKERNQVRMDLYLAWLYEYGELLKKEAIAEGASQDEAEKSYQESIREVTEGKAILSEYYDYLFSQN